MPLTGQAKTTYQREYMRRRRVGVTSEIRPREARVIESMVAGKSVSASLREAGFSNGALRKRLRPGGDLGEALRRTLDDKGLTLDRVIGKVATKMDATRRYGSGEDAIVADDNDAQLRATDQAIRLHERAGTIPAAAASGGGAGGLHYHLHLGDLRSIPGSTSEIIVNPDE